MKIFGLNITRQKSGASSAATATAVAENRGGWFPIIRESFAGAFQQNITVDHQMVLSYHAVYACITLIASDISKLCVDLVQQDANGIWSKTTSSSYSPVLRKPNRYQNRVQFWETWILSKLMRGNTYVLKQRDNRNIVTALYVLDPNRVRVLVAVDGSVFYQLNIDHISGLLEPITVPADEIIHDRFNCLFHPLVGTSPIFAAGVAATQGLAIQNQSAWFFGNKSQPGGVLTAPGAISQETADRLKADWAANYTGANAGKVAVLGDGLTYQRMSLTAEESQLVDQLKWTSQVVCSVFHVPGYKIGISDFPRSDPIPALNVEYYSQALQSLIEAAELCLDEGLGIGVGVSIGGQTYGTQFDIDNLIRMDLNTQMDVLTKSAGILQIDEMRAKIGMGPTDGGDAVYLQQQNFSLPALAKRDAKPDPFGTAPQPSSSSSPAVTAPAETSKDNVVPFRVKAKCDGHHQPKKAS